MINYTGLHKRPTLEGLVDYLANGQETIKYPDRFAKMLRNSPYLTQFDAEGIFEVEELDRKMREQEQKNQVIQNIVNQSGMSAQAVRATQRQPGVSSQPPPQTRSRTPPQTRGRSPTRRGLLRDKSLERALFGDDQYDKQVDDTAELIRQQNEEYERIAEQERKQNIHALSKSIVESVTQPHYIGQLTESQPAAAASSSGHKPSSQPAASASPKDHTPIDNHITISHWRQQPKEYLQSQLLLRIPDHPTGFKNLNKTELLDIIKKLINDKNWSRKDTGLK